MSSDDVSLRYFGILDESLLTPVRIRQLLARVSFLPGLPMPIDLKSAVAEDVNKEIVICIYQVKQYYCKGLCSFYIKFSLMQGQIFMRILCLLTIECG